MNKNTTIFTKFSDAGYKIQKEIIDVIFNNKIFFSYIKEELVKRNKKENLGEFIEENKEEIKAEIVKNLYNN